jgi:hypothetical protein
MMHSNQYRQEVKALVLKAYVRAGKEEQQDRMRVLIEDVMDSGLPLDALAIAFRAHAQKSPYPPVISDIVGVFRNKIESDIDIEIAKRWEYFLQNALSPYSKLEDWAYDARREIGESRCYAATTADVPWIKKEFVEIVKMQIQCKLRVIGDDRPWVMIGSTWALMPGYKKDHDFNKVGLFLKSKLELGKQDEKIK